jgi:hypothetical protein
MISFPHMTSASHQRPTDIARRAMSWERAPSNRPKTPNQPPQPAYGPQQASKPQRKPHPVERIAVRYAPRPPQSEPNVRTTLHRSRKSLKVNHQIKAQTAAHLRP